MAWSESEASLGVAAPISRRGCALGGGGGAAGWDEEG